MLLLLLLTLKLSSSSSSFSLASSFWSLLAENLENKKYRMLTNVQYCITVRK